MRRRNNKCDCEGGEIFELEAVEPSDLITIGSLHCFSFENSTVSFRRQEKILPSKKQLSLTKKSNATKNKFSSHTQ
jgi:hypothetical protein